MIVGLPRLRDNWHWEIEKYNAVRPGISWRMRDKSMPDDYYYEVKMRLVLTDGDTSFCENVWTLQTKVLNRAAKSLMNRWTSAEREKELDEAGGKMEIV